MKLQGVLITLLLLFSIRAAFSQCGTVTPNGNQTDYGNGQWYGYIYDGINNFTAYQGYITQSATFDYSFNGDNTPFTTTGGCSVDPNTFTVRFKMQLNIPCGSYQFTTGGDDGYRLSIDGGSTYLINNFADHPYTTTTSAPVFINTATTYLVLDYYENAAINRVSFNYTKISNGDGGTIGSNQSICFATTGDPAAFTSAVAAVFCTGNTLTYQWQSSPDNSSWSNIASANAVSYDPPAGFTAGTVYYRRRATDNINSDIVYSNTVSVLGQAQQGDQTTYGSGATPWIGYLYDGVNTYTSAAYTGYLTESAANNFDENFTCAACTINTNGCNLYTDTFTARFKSRQTIACGYYQFTIGADDGVRFSIDGGSTYLINDYTDHSYRSSTASIYLTAGSYDFVLEYYENTGGNRVTFDMTKTADGTAGQVSGDQNLCGSVVNPAAFVSILPANFCTGTVAYQWQDSPDNSTFNDIGSATTATYDIPSGFSGTRYYRRRATNGTLTFYSNTLTVAAEVSPGDQTTYGINSWIGYVYDGINTYTTAAYQGNFTESATFDESFCGNNCTYAINGCDFNTETFTVRFKMRITLANAGYTFTIGADDGVRLSINGGSSYLIDDYTDHGYRSVSSGVVNLNGTYDLVLEYYENTGGNRVTFNYTTGPLPVSLTEFKGTPSDDGNLLEWSTASEQNNDGFYVERSFNGQKFESLGWVAGSGNSLVTRFYSFTDEQPQQGKNYYRLNQKDFDGKQEYSNVISINFGGTFGFRLYPNPSKDNITISYSSQGDHPPYLRITDTKGVPVSYNSQITDGKIYISGLSPGFYIAALTVGESTALKKFILLE